MAGGTAWCSAGGTATRSSYWTFFGSPADKSGKKFFQPGATAFCAFKSIFLAQIYQAGKLFIATNAFVSI